MFLFWASSTCQGNWSSRVWELLKSPIAPAWSFLSVLTFEFHYYHLDKYIISSTYGILTSRTQAVMVLFLTYLVETTDQ